MDAARDLRCTSFFSFDSYSNPSKIPPPHHQGGFENIPYSEKDEYPSEICDGGYVKWSLAKSAPLLQGDGIEVGPINYPQAIKWDFNSAPFGWVARHHYTYARSTFETREPGVYLASFSHVVSFKIDNQSFPGNIYNYQHASKSAVWLEPGVHDIYVCIIWDIRVNGGYVRVHGWLFLVKRCIFLVQFFLLPTQTIFIISFCAPTAEDGLLS
jgi:hypothetical protein